MATKFDNGLATLIAALKAAGLLDQTLIVAQGEFGRTVGPPNSNGGRDHLQQQAVLFAGGGVKGGTTIGATNATGGDTSDPGWSRQRYVRAEDIEATVYSALGINWTTVRHDDPLGRGFRYVPFSEEHPYGPVNECRGYRRLTAL